MSLASGQISPVEHWKMTLAIIERLDSMGKTIEEYAASQQKEAVHVH